MCLISDKSLEEEFAKYFILIYVGSSVSIFSNKDLLKEAGCTSRHLKLETNGGEIRTNNMGKFHDLRE